MVTKPLKWRKARGNYFDDEILRAKDGEREEVMNKILECRELYHREPGGFDATEEDGPWEGAANLHVPMITDKVETATPKVMSAMWRANPFVNVSRPGGSEFDQVQVKNIENFLSWSFRNDIPDFYLTFENFLRNMFIDGTSFAKIRWERKVRRAIETHHLDSMTSVEGQEGKVQRPLGDLLTEIFGLGDIEQTLYDYTKIDESTIAVKFTEGGRNYEGKVELFETGRVDQVGVRVFRDIIERESPMIELVELEDLVFPFRSKSIESAKWIAHKTWYSYKEIESLVKSKEWHLTRDQLKTLKANSKLGDSVSDIQRQKDLAAGIDGNSGQRITNSDGEIDPNLIMVWEIYTEDYVDDDENPINVVYFMPEIIRTIAGMEYHDEIFPHGKRPFVSATYIPIAGRIYGTGMAELLYGLNLSVDHTINTVHHAMEITTNPIGFFSPMSMAQNGNGMLRLKPGTMVPVMNPRDVYFPSFGQQPLENYHATYNQMTGIADQLTFSQSIGGSSNYRNAPRTARGTETLMNAAEEKLSTIVEQLQATAWKSMIMQVSSLYGKYLTIDKWYHVTGEPNARNISPKELRDNLVFEFSGSLTSVNRDIQRGLIERLYSMLSIDPAYQQDPDAMNNLRRMLANSLMENGDVESILPSAPGQGGFEHPPYDQEQELQAMAIGRPIQVLPVDDHMSHIQSIEKYKKSDVYQTLPGEAKGLIEAHKKTHESMLQQQMQQQQKLEQTQGTGAANQAGQNISEPGNPAQGVPAQGGQYSALGGV